jgi:uncharacterized protein YxjI
MGAGAASSSSQAFVMFERSAAKGGTWNEGGADLSSSRGGEGGSLSGATWVNSAVSISTPVPAMRYVMKEKFWTVTNQFDIRDDTGKVVFQVKGQFFSLGDKLSFQDPAGKELLFIRQKMFALGPTFLLERNGEVIARVHRHLFTLIRYRFTVDVPGPNDIDAAGDFLNHEYTFARAGAEVPVATVSKRWFSWVDTYGIDIAPGEDEVMLLACAVVIDLVMHPSDGRLS